MNGNAGYAALLAFGLVVNTILAGTTPVWAAPSQARFCHEEYVKAHQAIAQGSPYDGAVLLIEMLRTVPGDDIALADQMVGPAQLLGFDVVSLMDWVGRSSLLAIVLDPDRYEFDKLLVAVVEAGSGIQSMVPGARLKLEQVARSGNKAYRATAACFLAEPRYYGQVSFRTEIEAILTQYPTLEFSQSLVEGPVIRYLQRSGREPATVGSLLSCIPYWNGTPGSVYESSPGLAAAAQVLPSMRGADISDDTVSGWAGALAAEKNPRARYLLVSLLGGSAGTPERRARMRAGLEFVASQPPVSPDVPRARMVLADNACADHEADSLKTNVLALLRTDPPPCTAERSMYEASMQSAQKAAKYLTRMGQYEDAVLVHRTLAAKYPNSTLAAAELKKAEALQSAPQDTALKLITGETDTMVARRQHDAARTLLQEIIDHTPQPALKAALTAKLASLGGVRGGPVTLGTAPGMPRPGGANTAPPTPK